MRPGFRTPLIRKLIRYPINKLTAPLVYQAKSGEIYIVPVGFHSDSASIPWPFRMLIPRNGRHTRSAYLHDFLFVNRPMGLFRANNLMLEAMKSDGVRFTRRWAIRIGLFIGSWVPWLRNHVLPENKQFTKKQRYGTETTPE